VNAASSPRPLHDRSVRIVVFDLGGVLVRLADGFEGACAVAGVAYRGWPDDPESRRARRATVDRHERGEIETAEYCRELARLSGDAYTPEELARVHDAWIVAEHDGVADLLDDLDRARVETGVLSNTNEAHWERQMFPPVGAATRFPTLARILHPHASHLLGARKPEPAVFARFEAATGRRGAEVLFFDDLPANVEGARAFGWAAALVGPGGSPVPEMRAVLAAFGVLPARPLPPGGATGLR
jgi:putative hydrolase of the HAD superfamily